MSSRRIFFWQAAAAASGGALLGSRLAAASPMSITAALPTAWFPVEDYGAVADGVTDNTAAFRAAIAAASAANGGTVTVDPGRYNFTDTLVLPEHVALVGTTPGPAEDTTGNNAATLLVSVPSSNRTAFIRTSGKTVISDLAFRYPNQVNAGTPIDYPPAILTTRTDNIIKNLYLENVYRGIYLNTAATTVASGRDLVDTVRIGVFGEAGIAVDNTLDVSRLNNIHIWPFYGTQSDLRHFAAAHTFGIIIKRADSIQLSNVFLFGLLGGLYLNRSTTGIGGASNGQASNFSADSCVQGGIIAAATENPQGWVFTNVFLASPPGTVAAVNLSPGGAVETSTAPHLNLVGGAMWGATPSAGWVVKGSSLGICHMTGITQNTTLVSPV